MKNDRSNSVRLSTSTVARPESSIAFYMLLIAYTNLLRMNIDVLSSFCMLNDQGIFLYGINTK